jgi:hypothetical protein
MEDDAAMRARLAVLGSSAADSQALDDEALYQMGLVDLPESEMQPTQSMLESSALQQPRQQLQRAATPGEARDPHSSAVAAALGSEPLDDDALFAMASLTPEPGSEGGSQLGPEPGSRTMATDAPEPSAAASGDRLAPGPGEQDLEQPSQGQQFEDDELLLMAEAVSPRGWGWGR